jgi:hypothetical protein
MKPSKPPSAATWILEHLTPCAYDQALAGDLLEEFRSGRTTSWYWRQVLATVKISLFRSLQGHRSAVVFAVLWSTFAPAWVAYVARLQMHFDFSGILRGIDWPWSTIADIALGLAADLSFVWTGMALYLVANGCSGRILNRTPHLPTDQAGSRRQSLLLSIPTFLPVQFLFGLLAVLLFPTHAIDTRAVTPLSLVTDIRPATIVLRLPFLLCLLYLLWGATSTTQSTTRTTA